MGKCLSLVPFILVLLLIAIVAASCGSETGVPTSAPELSQSDYEIIFVGNEWADVVFPHKDHSDREDGECFCCHNCADVLGDLLWNCTECHTQHDPEELCEVDEYHGCTFTQCNHCHEVLDRNPGLGCAACHTGSYL